MTVDVEVCATARDRRHALAIRYQVFAEGGYLDPAEHPDGIEHDHLDTWRGTVSLLARVDGKPAGTIRLCTGSPCGLEVAQHADAATRALLESWRSDPRNDVAEGSRFAVLAPYRGHSGVGRALLVAAVEVALARGVTHWVGAVNCGTHKGKDRRPAFAWAGFEPIGPAFTYARFREEAVPVCLRLPDGMSAELAELLDHRAHSRESITSG